MPEASQAAPAAPASDVSDRSDAPHAPDGSAEDVAAGFALAHYTPLQEYRSAADTKAGAILTACGLLFTLLASYSSHLMEALVPGGPGAAVTLAALAGFVVLSLGAVLGAFHTITPRFPTAPPSLAFFADIAAFSREDYIARVEALDERGALAQLVSYNHTLSCIVTEKFRQLQRAIRSFQLAALCWLLLMVLLGGRLLH